ncbi:hypothetical protein GC101_22035 [Paenibacillus sp. LMG 31459]|uniref:Uncharacterized protein n=1 Tax=Paenibacillus phytohabitans TaxID=2654978 RepID=A0ABX1YN56_9BACL|nr:hypothetical protein [Paenibacillus phytohabitans]NOU81546.1 hypothetical protein [Paenibacillus phytohabitans]
MEYSLEIEKAYLRQFEAERVITINAASALRMRLSKHPQLGTLMLQLDELRDDYYKTSKSYKRMKWPSLVKRFDSLFARTTELKVLAQEALQGIVESEYEKEVGIEIVQIKEEEKPIIETLNETVQNNEEDSEDPILVETYKDHPVLKYPGEDGYRIDFGTKRSKLVDTIEAARALLDPKRPKAKKKTGKIKDPNQTELPIRGGVRPGAGRKSKGVKKPITMAIPAEQWAYIDNLIQTKVYEGYADLFRNALYVMLPEIVDLGKQPD